MKAKPTEFRKLPMASIQRRRGYASIKAEIRAMRGNLVPSRVERTTPV